MHLKPVILIIIHVSDVIGDRASILFMLKYLNLHNIYLLYSTLCIPDLNSRKNALFGRLFGDD